MKNTKRTARKGNDKPLHLHPMFLLNGGVHQLPAKPLAQSTIVDPLSKPPRIESTGNGWFTVFGGKHGPFDRYGRENAEQALTEIVDRRRQDAECDFFELRSAIGMQASFEMHRVRCVAEGLIPDTRAEFSGYRIDD